MARGARPSQRVYLQAQAAGPRGDAAFRRWGSGGRSQRHRGKNPVYFTYPLREAIRPTPRQQGLDGEEAHPGTPYWPWARLLGHVFGLEMRTCPFCRRGTLRIMAVITQESVITRILRHLQLASVPPPLAPARVRQEIGTFD